MKQEEGLYMTVITISREFGSGGDLLAERVARALGYHLVDKAFISAVLCQYGIAEFDVEYEKQPGFWGSFDTEKAERRDTMVRMLNQVVRTVARHGNVVILGRSGYAILAGLADVLHVRLQAPLEDRIERVKAEQGIALHDAASLIKEKDRIRTAFIESFYHVPWDAPRAFDIAINTAIVPVDVAAGWVIEAARLRRNTSGSKPTATLIEVDPVLMQVISEKLNCTLVHDRVG
jgi:cytidylate kinase